MNPCLYHGFSPSCMAWPDVCDVHSMMRVLAILLKVSDLYSCIYVHGISVCSSLSLPDICSGDHLFSTAASWHVPEHGLSAVFQLYARLSFAILICQPGTVAASSVTLRLSSRQTVDAAIFFCGSCILLMLASLREAVHSSAMAERKNHFWRMARNCVSLRKVN